MVQRRHFGARYEYRAVPPACRLLTPPRSDSLVACELPPRTMALNAKVLEVILATLNKAPAAWHAEEVVACHEPSAALRAMLESDAAAMLAQPPPPFTLPEGQEAELVNALHGVAARGATAKLASMLATTNRECRAVIDAFASADERAARVAQAQATHDMVRALRESGDLPDESKATIVSGLASWCRAEKAATALDGRYGDEASPAAKWRAFGTEFAREATRPRRIRYARRARRARHMALQLARMLAAMPQHPVNDEQEEAEERQAWCTKLCELVRDAPA